MPIRIIVKCMMLIMHLGGNGTVTKMKNEIEELHLEKKERKIK